MSFSCIPVSRKCFAGILFYACLYFYFLVFLNVSINTIRLFFGNTKFCKMLVLLGLKVDGRGKARKRSQKFPLDEIRSSA